MQQLKKKIKTPPMNFLLGHDQPTGHLCVDCQGAPFLRRKRLTLGVCLVNTEQAGFQPAFPWPELWPEASLGFLHPDFHSFPV